MNGRPRSAPPLLARTLLRLALPARARAYVLDDLHEEFEDQLAAGVPLRDARRWYWEQVRGSILPGLRLRRAPRLRPPGSRFRLAGVQYDLRWTWRTIRRQPGFTAIAVGTLALGVGATTAMFGVVHGVLLKPLPYPDPEALVSVWHRAPGLNYELLNQAPATYLTYRDENRVFSGIGLWDNARVSVTGIGEPEEVEAIMISAPVFSVLETRPMLGRLIAEADDAPGAPLTTVLTYGYWQRRFGGDPGVIGSTVTLSDYEVEIIGVLEPGFRFLNFDPALFLPFQLDRRTIDGVTGFSYQAVARLRDGVTIEQANADVERMIPLVFDRFPSGRGVSPEEAETMGLGSNIRPLKEEVVGDLGTVLWLLLGTVGLVLLIAGANVANLFLARAEGRQREMAVRTALGAGVWQLGRQVLLESVSIALLGGAIGVALAEGCLRVLHAMATERFPRLDEIAIDPAVVGFALSISLAAGLAFGLYALSKVVRGDISGALCDGGRGGIGQTHERHRARSALVVSQLALGLVLLVGSGLMVRTFRSLLAVHPGFERPEELLTLHVSIPSARSRDAERTAAYHRQILERIRQIRGVTSAGLSSSVSMDGWDDNNAIYVEEFPTAEGVVPPIRQVKWVSDGYFATMENIVVAGRTISAADVRDRTPVAVVTANFAREYWSDPTGAIGKRISDNWKGPWYEIVGVVGDVHDDGVDRAPTPIVYWPMVRRDRDGTFRTQRAMGYAIRSSWLHDPAFLGDVQQAVWSVDPDLPLAMVRTLDEILARSRARVSFLLAMLGIAAAAAVLLAVVGVYGVISYLVTQRTREIGVRMAFGATEGDVNRLVLRQGAALAGLGIAIGLGASAVLTQLMSAVLVGVNPLDLVTYGAGAIALAAIALLASYVPARRAAGIDPTEALRWE